MLRRLDRLTAQYPLLLNCLLASAAMSLSYPWRELRPLNRSLDECLYFIRELLRRGESCGYEFLTETGMVTQNKETFLDIRPSLADQRKHENKGGFTRAQLPLIAGGLPA